MAFGVYLLTHFVALLPYGRELFSNQGVLANADHSPFFRILPSALWLSDAPWMVTILLVAACVGSVAFSIGVWDRAAAFVLWWVWASLLCRNPLITNPSLPYVGLLLLLHALLPAAPHGSLAARGRVDPGGNWAYPVLAQQVAWWLLMIGYSYSGYTKLVSPSWLSGDAMEYILQNPLARDTPARSLLLALPSGVLHAMTWSALALELLAAPLALVKRLRPWVWLALLGMHLGLIVLIDFVDLSVGMLIIHAFTFDPAWLPPRERSQPLWLFYDGTCGLCHGAVRSVLAEDRTGLFRFAPIGGEAFVARVGDQVAHTLPDSIVLQTASGELLTRSAAVRAVLAELGGLWRVVAVGMGLLPRAISDFFYDRVASVRRRLFRAPSDVCPVMPSELRARFAG